MKITDTILKEALNLKECPVFVADGISIDSRTVRPGEIFFAIKGDNFDGNEFTIEALAKGAYVAIVSDPKLFGERLVHVEDTLEALKSLGLHIKNKVSPRAVIGITGSVGKTTTKAWLSEILQNKHKVSASIKNYNTIYGLPISLSNLEHETDFCICEMGSNNPGEISELSQYVNPDIAIITNIFESHIGRFNNKNALAVEKISIIDGLKSGSTLIYDGDCEFVEDIKKAALEKNVKCISVGFSSGCDYCIKAIKDGEVTLQTPKGLANYKMLSTVEHFAYISACVIAMVDALGVQADEFLQHFENLSPLPGRGFISSFKHKGKKFQVIDDSYNASPSAVLASLKALSNSEGLRKIAILGMMGELGEHEEHYHKLIAQKVKDLKIDVVFFIGHQKLHSIFIRPLEKNIICFEKISEINVEKILEIIENDDIVLLKGSRSVELNRFIDHIK